VQSGGTFPIWRAVRRTGAEVKSTGDLPTGAVGAAKPQRKTTGVLKKK
jgi:hypothetical protein